MQNQDALLLERLRAGEIEAVGDAFERHGRMVYNVCCRVLRDHAAAEDALQGTFLLLQRKAATLSSDVVLSSWLYRSGELVARESMRSKSRRVARERDAMQQSAGASKPEDAAWEQICPNLDRVLAALPERLRNPIVLTYLEGRSIREAADILNVPEGTIKSRVSRGLETMRSRLAAASPALSVSALATLLAAHSSDFGAPHLSLDAVLESARQQAEALRNAPQLRVRGPKFTRWIPAALAIPALVAIGYFAFPAAPTTPTAPVAPTPVVTLTVPASAAAVHTFYVSPSGDDANDGGTMAHAWKTLTKVNAATFVPGDQILFQRGGEWRESLRASSDGAEGKPITYSAYGQGEKPKFWGSDVLKNDQFKPESKNVYVCSMEKPVGAVLVDHAVWIPAAEAGKLSESPDTFEWKNGRLRLNSAADPRTSGRVYTACVRESVIDSNGKSHLVFRDLAVDESAFNEGVAIRVALGSDIILEGCATYRAGSRHVAAINVDRFTARGLYAAYAQTNPQQAHFFLSYCDKAGANVTHTWTDCVGEHCENPTHRNHIVFGTSGTGLGVITIQNLVARDGQVSLGHDLSINWNSKTEPHSIRFIGGRVENAPLEVFAWHALIDGVTFSGDNACLDLYGSDNLVQNAQFLNINPKNGGTTGYSTAIICRAKAQRNTIRYCSVAMAKDADGNASCLTLGGPGSMTQWYGNIFSSPRLALNFEGVAGAGDITLADYNFYNPTAEFTTQRLTVAQWQQKFDAHSLTGDPGFSDLKSGAQLRPGSAALQLLAIPESLRIPTDIAGRARKSGALGAYAGN